jgi:hypothetical protein
MSIDHSTTQTVSNALAVQLTSWPIDGDSAFSVFVHLREVFGHAEVCVFESLGGPAADTNRALIGVSPLLDVIVRDGRIALTGGEALVNWADERLSELDYLSSDEPGIHVLTAKDDVWDALRHLQAGFDAPGQDDASFRFGYVTVLSYDAVAYMERLPEQWRADDRVERALGSAGGCSHCVSCG